MNPHSDIMSFLDPDFQLLPNLDNGLSPDPWSCIGGFAFLIPRLPPFRIPKRQNRHGTSWTLRHRFWKKNPSVNPFGDGET